MRVKVWKFVDKRDPEKGCLGEGEHLGCVPMTEVYTEEEYKERKKAWMQKVLESMGMPHEGVVFEEMFENMWKRKVFFQPFSEQTTPKIRLDSGEIVYGCQVWWRATNT